MEKEGFFARTIENLQKLDKCPVTACNSAVPQESIEQETSECTA
jgi:hypothetical protein